MTILKENWKELIKPTTFSVTHKSDNEATIVIKPLERGFGLTLGNALRRVLLSSIRGFAVTSIRIDGILHEYGVIEGIKEDVQDIIMNIKSLVIRKDSSSSSTIRLKANKVGEVKASDIVTENGVEVLNKDLVICNIEKSKVELNIEMTVESGVGYKIVTPEENQEKLLGTINLDALFSPVKRVNYTIENTRVGNRTDYDKLIIDIDTDGTVTPEDAIGLAAKIIQTQLDVFVNFDVKDEEKSAESSFNNDINPNFLKKIDEMELSVRSYNCLKNENINYIGDLVQKNETEMLKMPNFGRKSLNELKDNLKAMGLTFGMKIPNWSPKSIEELSKKKKDF